jgi:hypothetical protein
MRSWCVGDGSFKGISFDENIPIILKQVSTRGTEVKANTEQKLLEKVDG